MEDPASTPAEVEEKPQMLCTKLPNKATTAISSAVPNFPLTAITVACRFRYGNGKQL